MILRPSCHKKANIESVKKSNHEKATVLMKLDHPQVKRLKETKYYIKLSNIFRKKKR